LGLGANQADKSTQRESFIVGLWSLVFWVATWATPYHWITKSVAGLKRGWTPSHLFTDAWLLAHLVAAASLVFVPSMRGIERLEWVAVGYGGFRVFETLVYQINVLLFGGYRRGRWRQPQVVLSRRRLVVTSLQNYVEVILWFALFYRHWQAAFIQTDWPLIPPDRVLTWLNLSFATMTTFGYPTVQANESLAVLLTFVQSAIGALMALIILAGFVSLLPTPETRDQSEQ